MVGAAFGQCVERSPNLETANEVFWFIRGVHFLASHIERYEQHRDLLGPNVLSNVEAALKFKPQEISWAMREQTRLHREFQNFLDDIDILICPTAAVPPFPVEKPYCSENNGNKRHNHHKWDDKNGKT